MEAKKNKGEKFEFMTVGKDKLSHLLRTWRRALMEAREAAEELQPLCLNKCVPL